MKHEARSRVGLDDDAQLAVLAELFHAHTLMIRTASGGFERIPVSPQMILRDEDGKPRGVFFAGQEHDMSFLVPDVATRARAAKAVMDVTGTSAAQRLRERVTDAEMEVRRGKSGIGVDAPRVTINRPVKRSIESYEAQK